MSWVVATETIDRAAPLGMPLNAAEEPYAIIPLHGKYGQGKVAKVSLCDLPKVRRFRWYATENDYARTYLPKRQVLTMHRFILDAQDGEEVDHRRQHDTLDNRRSNIRLATRQQNARNIKRHPSRKMHSIFKGVSLSEKGLWTAAINTGEYRRGGLGNWLTELEAARAHDAGARFYHGEFAALNFPDELIEPADASELRRQARQARGRLSKFYGVVPDLRSGGFVAQFTRDGKTVNIAAGFDSEEAAAKAHDSAQVYYNGANAKTNFPGSKGKSIRQIRRELRQVKDCESPYYGVRRLKGGTFAARIHDGKEWHLGVFADEVEAAKCVDACFRYLFGADARTNFNGSEMLSPEEMRERNMGKGKVKPSGKSQYKFVNWHKKNQKWTAHLGRGAEKKYLGSFHDEVEAARAVDEARSARGLPRVNFPAE